MPSNPFAKSFDSKDRIDLPLFSLIHNDSAIAGAYKLEGNQFQRTVNYLEGYFAYLRRNGPLPEAATLLQKRMYKLLDIETELGRIRGLSDSSQSKPSAMQALEQLSMSTAHELLRNLGQGDYLSMPGGWLSAEGGHGMVYQFKRTAEGLELYVHNAGAGINYHERQSAHDRELYYPVQAYKIPLPVDEASLASFLRKLMLPMLPGLRAENDQGFNAKRLYLSVFSQIHFLNLNASLVSMTEQVPHAFTAGQLAGSCAERCLHQMLKANFKSLPEYQRFIYSYKRYALDDFMGVLTDQNLLDDRRAQSLVNHALNTMFRTLNIPGLFTTDQIMAERAVLQSHRDALIRSRKPEPVMGSPVVAPRAPVKTIHVILPTVLRPVVSQYSPSLHDAPFPLKILVGGRGLLGQMDELRLDCERLKTTGQDSRIIEQLELVFANFPLPLSERGFERGIDFYQAINRDNKAEFYKQIASLQALYLDACKKLCPDAGLPRMLVVGLSVMSMLDYVAHQLPVNEASGPPSWHAITSSIFKRLFEYNQYNPYFATNNALLDARLQSIKSLYSGPASTNLLSYYNSIIDSEPHLKRALLSRYIKPVDAEFAEALATRDIRELYCFTQDIAALNSIEQYQPLIKKFNQQQSIESTLLRGLKPFLDGVPDIKSQITISWMYKQLKLSSAANDTLAAPFNGQVSKQKYNLLGETPCKRALDIDYSNCHNIKYNAITGKRSDNHIQLLPSESAQLHLTYADAHVKSTLAQRQIDRREIANRELFHLRGSPSHQIKLTLDYFLNHLSKLSDSDYQCYVEANLFEPGLLAAELAKNPEILKQIDKFIEAGLDHYVERGLISQPSLGFIRLAYLVNQYAVEHNPSLANIERLGALQKQLTILLQVNADNETAIKQSLHQYQFLTTMTRLKFKLSDVERQASLELGVSSFFYMNAKNNPKATMDTATQFELNHVQYNFKRHIMQSDALRVGLWVGHALENLNLGVCDGVPTKEGAFYTVKMKRLDVCTVYRVDVGSGLIFNDANGMAFAPVPLDISHHPVMKLLKPGNLESCFRSSDGNVFELNESGLRFIRGCPASKYRVQKQWTVGGGSRWYELHDLCDAQKKAFNLDSTTIQLPFPEILKQRDTQVWVSCDESKSILITENHRPVYQCLALPNRWEATQLREDGVENGFTLCTEVTWLHTLFAKFEAPEFITVCENRDSYQIKFGRYGLTILASQEGGIWVYRLQNNPAYTLVGDIDTLLPGVAGLIFEDKISHRSECYLPLQPFICTGEPSLRSEFHDFKPDISAAVPKALVAKLTALAPVTLLPWQYTGTERVIRYQMDTTGQPCAETAADALYLCYVYLGSQNPEKAWAILEDCEKRLGGLEGTVEELAQLYLIMQALPSIIKKEDSTAIISTPKYVACQLKALALLTSAFTPDKVISFPPKTFDLKTPDGLYQNRCWKDLQAFHAGLNKTVYDCYTRFQNLQRHLIHNFHLTDAERKSLLDYYHFNVPGDEPKALGALGYEWQVLQLKTLRLEYETLKAEAQVKGHLPEAYQKRLEEIGRFLQQDTLIRAHHTDLKSVPIDLSIPPDMRFEWYMIRDCNSLITHTWWVDRKKALTTEGELDKAMKALTSDVTDGELIQYFACYYKLLMEGSPSSGSMSVDRRAKLINFCHQYIKAHRHVALDKQDSKATYLCNILYRIANNRDEFNRLNLNTFTDIINQAKKLPAPPIEVHQACHTTHTALAKAGKMMMWDALKKEVPVPSVPMVVAPCAKLDDFSVEKLIDGCALSDRDKQSLVTIVCKEYRKQARIFGTASIAVAASKVERVVLSSEEREAGRVQGRALNEMKRIASDLLAQPHVRKALQDKAQDFIEKLETAQQELLDSVLRLANIGPADPEQKRCRDLELDGGARAPLDKQRLLSLYFRADMAQYAMATGLSDAQIEQLHTGLSHFLGLSVRQQALQRFHKDLVKHGAQTTDLSALQQIVHGLFTENLVDANIKNPVNGETEGLVDPKIKPVLMMIQYHDNILLRPQQITAIKQLLTLPKSSPYTFHEAIEKIIMGGGKSKVMLPVLAQSKATGSNLVVVEVPPALFKTNCVDLAQTSGRLFNQKVYKFQFNRDSDCSPESLAFLHSQLIDVMVHKDYMVTTGDAVQSLELKYLEFLLQRPEDEEKQKEWKLQCTWLDKIVVLFRTRADVVIDEVHQGLLLKKKLNYTLGDKRSIPTNIINECVELYNYFEQVSLTEVLGGTFAGKTLTALLENNQLITQEDQWQKVTAYLTQQLVDDLASPLQQTLRRVGFHAAEKKSLLNYLANQGDCVPDCVLRTDKKAQTIFALYKEQVSQLLPQTLKRLLNVNYGVSQCNLTSALAIPYVANNVPSERSRFGNYLESINFTIQMLMIGGFRPALLKEYLQQLQVQARQELLKEPGRKTIDNTPTGLGFRDCAPGFEFSLSQLCLDDEQQFDKVFKALHKNKVMISAVLKTNVLAKIQIESQILHSDAYNHVDIYRSCQGITGTPWNSSTYHQRLLFDKSTTAATDGFILDVLDKKNTAIRRVSNTSLDKYLTGLFTGKGAHESVRAIIDICASFKGISNLSVANKLADYIRLNPVQFSMPSPLKYVLFFNEDNVLCALDIKADSTPIVIGSTDPDVINAKLGCTPDERFSYYDQSHTVGVDLKQALSAKALVLVDRETHLQSFLQGCMRMRGLQDEQSVELIVPENFEIPPLNDLFLQMAANEERQLRQDNFSAAQAKMTNVIRADFMQRLLALNDDDMEKKHDYALAFKSYFVELESQDFCARYGGVVTECDAKDILKGQRERLLSDWVTVLEGLHAEGLDTAKVTLSQGLDQIINDALPICPGKYLSPTRQEQGKEVEVQKQVLVELQREAQREQQLFNPLFVPSAYKPLKSSLLTQNYAAPDGFLSLTALCSPGAGTLVPDFGDIYAGPNYYKSYENQTKFVGPFLKPVHAILFRQRANGKLDSLILSQKEAEDITEIMRSSPLANNIWLSTTQHTVLEGKPPANVNDNIAYQGMIEKIRFFNGEFRLLLDGDIPPNWLSEQTEQKLSFFKQNLQQYRETESSEVASLQQVLSQKQNAYRYIAEHPLKKDYDTFDWTEISEELTDADIEECRNLAEAFARANQNWQIKSYDAKKCQAGLRLSIQASSYINSYFDTQLMILRLAFPLFQEGHVDEGVKADIDALLPLLLKDFILNAQYKRQTPLQFLLKKASLEADNVGLMRIAEWLMTQKVDVNTLDIDGRSALEQVILANGAHVLKTVEWLFKKNATCLVQKDVWCKLPQETLWGFFNIQPISKNEQFLLACVEVFRKDETKLKEIITRCVALPKVLEKVIEVMDTSLESVLPVLLANPQFIASAELVRQLLQKLRKELREQVISSLSASTKLSPDVLTVIIKGSFGEVNNFRKLLNTHGGSFSATTLNEMMRALPLVVVAPPSSEIITLLQTIVRHPRAESEVLNAAVNYTLKYKPQDMQAFWSDLSLQKWGAIDANTLCKLFSNVSEAARASLFNSQDFKDNQDSVITKLAQSTDPMVLDVLFQHPEVKLESKHLMLIPLTRLDAKYLPGILRHMVGHTAADQPVLKKILELKETPLAMWMWGLLDNEKFVTDVALVRQLLGKLSGEVCERDRNQLLKSLSSRAKLSSDMLTLIIEQSFGDVSRFTQLITTHGKHLTENNLRAMVRVLPSRNGAELEPSKEVSTLLQQIVGYAPAVWADAVLYAMNFEPPFIETFCKDIDLQTWETFNPATLCKLLLKMTDAARTTLFNSRGYRINPGSVIDKFIQSADPKVFSVLLKYPQVELESGHLRLMMRLGGPQVQAILPQLAKHSAADQAILQQVIELMNEPTKELLSALLANEQFKTKVLLVKQLLDKVQGDERRQVISQLSSDSKLSSDILTVIIEESAGDFNGFIEMINTPDNNLSEHHLYEMVRALPPRKGVELEPSKEVSALLKKIIGHARAASTLLEGAVIYTLNFEKQFIGTFWQDLSRKQWEKLSGLTLRTLFLNLTDQTRDALFNSQGYKTDPVIVIDKLIQSLSPVIHGLLLKHPQVNLAAKHLLQMMKLPAVLVQEILPHIVQHAAADEAALKKVIEVMKVPTDAVLLSALYANETFKKSVVLVNLLLDKVQGDDRKKVLRELSAMDEMSSEMLTVILEKNAGDVNSLTQMMPIHGRNLSANHLCTMVRALPPCDRWSGRPSSEMIELLRQIVKHEHAEKAVLEAAVKHALTFNPNYMDNLWEKLSLQRWDNLDSDTLRQLFLKLSERDKDHLFTSQRFTVNPDSIINKLIQSANPGVCKVILQNQHVKLESRHLMDLLTTLEDEPLQSILPQLAQHSAVDEPILQKMIERTIAPTEELLSVLFANEQFITNVVLIKQLLGKLQGAGRQQALTALSHIPKPQPEILELIIKENQFNENGLKEILRLHPELSSTHLKSRLPTDAVAVERKSIAKIIAPAPAEASETAFNHPKFMPRAVAINPQVTNYSFLLKCLAGIAMIAGAAMLVFGLLYLQPIFVQAGISLMATVAVSVCLANCGLFGKKEPKKPNEPGIEPAPNPNIEPQ